MVRTAEELKEAAICYHKHVAEHDKMAAARAINGAWRRIREGSWRRRAFTYLCAPAISFWTLPCVVDDLVSPSLPNFLGMVGKQ
uniref:Uncharacterized protein n=1 Tax=Setaria viridis TaxID=4556 RepID=A0A4U6VK71_SETVI|nr:hypothetical protein SEVIR_2G009450v2 [Setaria viridis]